MNPVDEYLQTKEAAGLGFLSKIKPWGKRVGQETLEGVASSAAPKEVGKTLGSLGLIGAGVGLAAGAKRAYHAITKKTDFNAMMDANPDLKEFQRENPKQFSQHYNSFRTMNPQFASEPTVAGTYMRQMSLNPESAGKTIVESIGGRPAEPIGLRDVETALDLTKKLRPEYKPMTRLEAETAPLKQQLMEADVATAPLRRQQLEQQVARGGEEVANIPLKRQQLMQQLQRAGQEIAYHPTRASLEQERALQARQLHPLRLMKARRDLYGP